MGTQQSQLSDNVQQLQDPIHEIGFGWVWLDLGMLDSALKIDEPFKEPFKEPFDRFGFRYGNSVKSMALALCKRIETE